MYCNVELWHCISTISNDVFTVEFELFNVKYCIFIAMNFDVNTGGGGPSKDPGTRDSLRIL